MKTSQKQIRNSTAEFPNFVIFKIDKSKINVDVPFEDLTCKEYLQVQEEGERQVKRNKKYLSGFDNLLNEIERK